MSGTHSYHLVEPSPWPAVGAAGGFVLVLGGAVSNLVDRIIIGAVLDFLDFHLLGFHWPAFNLADSCIVIGALLLLYKSLYLPTQKRSD